MTAGPGTVRLTVRVSGRVQGVGFRWWARARALELGLTGSATNTEDGRVEVVAQGPRADCERLLALLGTARGDPVAGDPVAGDPGPGDPAAGDPGPDRRRPGRVTSVAQWWSEPRAGLVGFQER